MKQLTLLVGLGLLGCVRTESMSREPDDPDDPPAFTQSIEPGNGLVPPEEEHNGRYMLSELLDQEPYTKGGVYFAIDLTGTPVTFARSASLAVGSLPWNDARVLPRMRFAVDANTSVSLAVAGGTADVTRYLLTRHVTGGEPKVICEDAVPVLGIIKDNGLHVRDDTKVTLSCGTGAVGKCIEFLYPPGTGGPLWDAHQACMRAVRADYCANGTAHTRIGTAIEILDLVNVHPAEPFMQLGDVPDGVWPPPVDRYFFEAAFAAGARPAVCVRRTRWPGQLPSACVDAMPDEIDCDDPTTTVADLRAQGAVLLIGSYYNTLRLNTWRRDQLFRADDLVATTAGYYVRDGEEIQPAPNFGRYEFVRREGILLRVPPNDDTRNLTAVYAYRELARDRFILSTAQAPFNDPTQFVQIAQEGWVYNTPPGGVSSKPLRLYRHRVSGDYWSTTGEVEADWLPYPDAATYRLGYIRILQ